MNSTADAVQILRRQLRILAILAGAEGAGMSPVPSRQLHTFGYFADALAPVWGLRILDARLLKRQEGPKSSELQRDVDHLVGKGIVTVSEVSHSIDSDGLWRLDANYALNREFAFPILEQAHQYVEFAEEIAYAREVVFALSALGSDSVTNATHSDASYSDELVDAGAMVNLESTEEGENLTVRVADRFGTVVPADVALTDAEKVHLYIRELYTRLHEND